MPRQDPSLIALSLAEESSARLDQMVAMMRELSLQTDPEEMVQFYIRRVRQFMPVDRTVSVSRRGLEAPHYRITRSSVWKQPINPWKDRDRLPLLEGGFIGDVIYGDMPMVTGQLAVPSDDPAAEYFEGMSSLMALPNFDQGEALNWSFLMKAEPDAFDPEALADRVWMSNLFGRATSNLVLKEDLRKALEFVERELNVVASIQRSLLPTEIPDIPNLSLAAHYQTSRWAGGDYYDFFHLPGDRWGLLIADVSGHGTPAAVMMAITHAIAHGHPGHPEPPDQLLTHVHERLLSRYVGDSGTFVTAFYGIFDPETRRFSYACAGHNPPRLRRCRDGSVSSLDHVAGLPLALFPGQEYESTTVQLQPGDQIVLYTDGITEATDVRGRMFGLDRLDQALATCRNDAPALVESVLVALEAFTGGQAPDDDRTLVVAKVR